MPRAELEEEEADEQALEYQERVGEYVLREEQRIGSDNVARNILQSPERSEELPLVVKAFNMKWKLHRLCAKAEWQAVLAIEDEALESAHDAMVPLDFRSSIFSYLGGAHAGILSYHRAIEMYELFRAGAQTLQDREWEGIACCNMGRVYGFMGEHQRAIDLYTASSAIAHEVGDTLGQYQSWKCMGYNYYLMGEYEQSIEWHEKVPAEAGGADILEVAMCHLHLDDYARAVELSQEYYSCCTDPSRQSQHFISQDVNANIVRSTLQLGVVLLSQVDHSVWTGDPVTQTANGVGCAWCGTSPANLLCTRCRAVDMRTIYCSKECQVHHWRGQGGHKHDCGQVAKDARLRRLTDIQLQYAGDLFNFVIRMPESFQQFKLRSDAQIHLACLSFRIAHENTCAEVALHLAPETPITPITKHMGICYLEDYLDLVVAHARTRCGGCSLNRDDNVNMLTCKYVVPVCLVRSE